MSDVAILLCRHAESTWNAAGRWQGHGDPPLSARGRGQAAALARRLAPLGVSHLVASDLTRARQTAEALGAVLGLAPVLDARLRELDVGAWTGLTRAQIAAAYAEDLARFDAGDPVARPSGGESRGELRQRALAALAAIQALPGGGLVAIVTHLGVIRALGGMDFLDHARWCRIASSGATGPSPPG